MSVRRVTVIMTSAKGQRSEEVYDAPPGDRIEGLKFPLSVGRPGGRYEIEIKLEEHVEEPDVRWAGLRCDKCGTLWKNKMRQIWTAAGSYSSELDGALLACPLCGSREFHVHSAPVRVL